MATKDLPISLRFSPYDVYHDVSSALLQLVDQRLNCTHSRSQAFRYGSRNINPGFNKNRTYDFRPSTCTRLCTKALGQHIYIIFGRVDIARALGCKQTGAWNIMNCRRERSWERPEVHGGAEAGGALLNAGRYPCSTTQRGSV